MRKFSILTFALLPLILLSSCGSQKSTDSMGGMKMSHPTASPLAAGQGAPAAGGGSLLNAPIPSDVLNAPIFDALGKSFTLASLKGQTVVLADFLTSCQEICPMTSINMRTIGDAIAASPLKDSVKVIELSVDSQRDTASRLTAYQKLYQDSNWIVASGSDASLTKIWKFFGNSYSKTPYSADEMQKLPVDWQTGKKNTYDITHTDEVLIINAQQSWAWLDLGNPNPGKASIPAKLKAYLSEDGLNNLAKPQEPSWTSEAVLSALSTITGKKIN